MPLTIKNPCEPLAHNPDLKAPFAGSDAHRLLLRQMELYVDGRTNGGSFLIAGHRGSGKTWLVDKAVERLQFPNQQLDSKVLTRLFPRPILIRLHGPDLLLPPDFRSDPRLLERLASNSSSRSLETSKRELALHAMSEISLALHRALCEEMAHSYMEHAADQRERGESHAEDLDELAAQFQIELDQAPGPARLLQFWRILLGKKLKEGVLRRPHCVVRKGPHDLRNHVKQGFRELVALTTAFHMQSEIARHRRGSKKPEKEKWKEPDREDMEEGFWGNLGRFLLTGGQLINPAFGLVIGGVVFVALMETHIPLPVSLLTAFLAAVSTTILLNFAASRVVKFTFVTDHTVASLNRSLPLFVRRVREAGLHPIFVVDELDKVDNEQNILDKIMERFMDDLKFFVKEQAFFCFLSDRSYFDRLMVRKTTTAYALEDTYFNETVFITYSRDDFDVYFESLFEGTPDDAASLLAKKLLLFRSRMHLGDLHRVLAQLAAETYKDNEPSSGRSSYDIEIDDTQINKNPGFRIAVFYQLCVEFLLLDDKDLRNRLRQDPDFTQNVYDALYYPARCWELGQKVTLAPDELKQYLLKRHGVVSPSQAAETSAKLAREISSPDFSFLKRKITALLEFLEKPHLLSEQIEIRLQTPRQDTERRLRTLNSGLMAVRWNDTLILKSADAYVWIWDEFGRLLEGVNRLKALREFLNHSAAENITIDSLSNVYFLLSSYPPWAAVENAVRQYDRIPAEQQKDLPPVVTEFDRMLRDYGILLRTGLYYAVLLAASSARGSRPFSATEGLQILAQNDLRPNADPHDGARALDDKYKNQLDEIGRNLDPITCSKLRKADQRLRNLDPSHLFAWLPALTEIIELLQ